MCLFNLKSSQPIQYCAEQEHTDSLIIKLASRLTQNRDIDCLIHTFPFYRIIDAY